jgi:hypothetical protein
MRRFLRRYGVVSIRVSIRNTKRERTVKQVSENLGAPMVGLSMWVVLRRVACCALLKLSNFSDANLKGGRLADRGW